MILSLRYINDNDGCNNRKSIKMLSILSVVAGILKFNILDIMKNKRRKRKFPYAVN